jgi:hypothetical protein
MQANPSAQVFNMGERKATFGPNLANARIMLYVMPVFGLVGLILLFNIPIGGIVMLLIAGGLFVGYRLQMRARAEVYEKGVATTDWLGRSQSFRWEEVAAVYEFIGYHSRTWAPIQWVYTVHLKDGRQVKLDMAYEKVRSLGGTVLAETGKTFLPQSLELYRAGKTVAFGEQIAISPAGFVSGGQSLPWDQVARVVFSRHGDLTLHKKDQRLPWKLVMHPRIANYPTFRAFLQEVVKGTPAEAAVEDPARQA